MRENLINAKYGIKELTDDDMGHNDGLAVIINKRQAFTRIELEKLLLHECLHHNVTRARVGCPSLNEDIDHYAMAMLGDPDELSNMDLGWFDCIFPNCTYHNPVDSDTEEESEENMNAKQAKINNKKSTINKKQ
eukprot:UN28900